MAIAAAGLLVFDNCEDPALLAQWRPTSGGCCVLVTSRRGRWPAGQRGRWRWGRWNGGRAWRC
ncbi:MAG: hypothetical protein R2911_19995 [Caldilineaceae bacterium]